MTTKVEKTVTVNVPISTVYNQWTQFEDFPQFMGGVQEVTQLDDRTLHWVAEIAGVRREWDAAILEQVPDSKIAWVAIEGSTNAGVRSEWDTAILEQFPDSKIAWAAIESATNAGAVYFEPTGADSTLVRLSLEYQPEGLVEKAGDFLNIVEKRAEADLEKFKGF